MIMHAMILFSFISTISTIAQQPILSTVVQPGVLIFDIGGCLGTKTEEYLRTGAGKVICVEPQKICLEHLYRKFSNHPVTIIPMGVSHIPGTVEFYRAAGLAFATCSQEWQQVSRYADRVHWDDKEIIKVTTLDRLIDLFGIPYFCKIDVENYEYQVLQGLSQPIRYVSIEFHKETLYNTQKCIDRFTDLGYKLFNFGNGEDRVFALSEWVSAQEIMTILEEYSTRNEQLWGDVYAQYTP